MSKCGQKGNRTAKHLNSKLGHRTNEDRRKLEGTPSTITQNVSMEIQPFERLMVNC